VNTDGGPAGRREHD